MGPVCEKLSPPSIPLIATHRVTVIHLAFGVLDHHHQLGLEGNDQHWALLHHLAQGQLQETEVRVSELYISTLHSQPCR